MSISIQTNVASLVAQNNLRVNNDFQNQTITRLTSGYRINQSGDDAAGLSIANQYRSSIAELNQGVRNANDGVSQLQIVDGGLNNITMMLDRMKTLATQAATTTFNGNRATLDQEYQTLAGEITRQATNIGLVAGGQNSVNMSVYIGGGPSGGSLGFSQININLNGIAVDATGLGLSNTSVAGADQGVRFASAPDVRTGTFLATATASYEVHTGNGTYTATVGGTGSAQSGSALVTQLNQQLAGSGVSARINTTDGHVEFVGSAFSITSTGGATLSGTDATITNDSLYNRNALAFAATTGAQTLRFTIAGQNTDISLVSGMSAAGAATAINQAMNSKGVTALVDTTGAIDLQGSVAFTSQVTSGGGNGGFGALASAAATSPTISGTGTSAASSAILATTPL
jgi:flagellin